MKPQKVVALDALWGSHQLYTNSKQHVGLHPMACPSCKHLEVGASGTLAAVIFQYFKSSHRKSHRARPVQNRIGSDHGSVSGVYWTKAQRQTHLSTRVLV